MSVLDKYKDFAFRFEMNEPGVLELIFDGPNLNAVDERVHSDIPYVWNVIDQDPDVRVVIVRGAGRAFSAGGSFDLMDKQMADYGTLTKVMRESRDLYYNMIDCSKPIISAIHGPAVGAGLVVALMADISIAAKNATIVDGHTRLGHRGRRSCGFGLAGSLRHGQGEVPAADLRQDLGRRGRADRTRVDGGRGKGPSRHRTRRRQQAEQRCAGSDSV